MAIKNLQSVISHATHYLLSSGRVFYKPQFETQHTRLHFDLDDARASPTARPLKTVLQVRMNHACCKDVDSSYSYFLLRSAILKSPTGSHCSIHTHAAGLRSSL